ncbi:aminotransferase class V-fold PLP-dependent enzyme [Roseateles amylovorans]|uniref:Aminotransferase class V-fold PLP-dependent enzyme n=1 Tax=Roseateles amylovorans TaxID=2978473 RepID=A0ABY6AXQ2_9BURK|nr:aminotransferase class V-fold PLP-dependent enzyme [Roseateles amylovorans]UXH76534.1 aminotransferase class V-fold PLP-dependent enzyme [Roseateles amylovorans]
MTAAAAGDWLTALNERLDRLRAAEPFKLGYPGWSAAFPPELMAFFSHELNNYGDPEEDPVFDWHTKDLERELVDAFATLFAATPSQRWGYVTSGGSEGIMVGLWCARTRLPRARVYHSTAAHSCVARTARLLGLQPVAIATDARGEMDDFALERQLRADGASAAIVVATIGTTLTEAVDDVPKIRRALQRAGVDAAYLHADAAFAGIPLALNAGGEVPFGLNHCGVDSLSFSGHKFLGVPFPCGLVMARDPQATVGVAHEARPLTDDATHAPHAAHVTHPHASAEDEPVRMCGAPDLVSSSRSGHAALALWFQWRRFGMGGLRDLAQRCRQLAERAEQQLNRAGWEAWRSHPDALTVVFRTPPAEVLRRWPMPAVGGLSHIVCTPGVTAERVNQFVAALSAAVQRKDERCEQP